MRVLAGPQPKLAPWSILPGLRTNRRFPEDPSQQAAQTAVIACLTLPDDKHAPPCAAELLSYPLITGNILRELAIPEPPVGSRLVSIATSAMLVPEATVNEDY